MKYILVNLLFVSFSIAGFSQELTGKWKIDVNIKEIGPIQFLMDFTKTSDTTFAASSRPGALKNIIGGIKYSIAKGQIKYKNGSIAHIYNGVINSDSLKGVLVTPKMVLYVSARLHDGKMTGAFYYQDKRYYEFTAVPFAKDFVDYNYVSLISDIKNTFHDNIYDSEVLKTKEWSSFYNQLDELGPEIHDDLEMFIYFSYLSSKIKMSHIAILKYNPWDSVHQNDTSKYISQVSHRMIDENTAFVKFGGFQLTDTLIVRNFFRKIIDEKIPKLIIDLRGCSGGDYSSMLLGQYLATKTFDAGFFIGNKYFQANRELPNDNTIQNLPDYKGKSLEEFLKTIVDYGLLKGSVVPDKYLHYTGKVYILIDNNSLSATEPIAYFLKHNNLATLVGEKTGGEMLSSTVITVKDSWSLLIPIADYYTSDRFRIEQKGVSPDIKVKSEDALDYVLKMEQ